MVNTQSHNNKETAETLVNKLLQLGYSTNDIKEGLDKYKVQKVQNNKIMEKIK